MVEATHAKVYNQLLISITTCIMFWCMSSYLWAPLQLQTLWLSLGKSNVVFTANIKYIYINIYINELYFIEKALKKCFCQNSKENEKNLSSQPAVIEPLGNPRLSFVFKGFIWNIMHRLNKEFTAHYCDL